MKKADKKAMLQTVCNHFVNDGKVVVKDIDRTIKESAITGVYSDYTITLDECIESEWSIFKVTLVPK